jgi:hypothetical protein
MNAFGLVTALVVLLTAIAGFFTALRKQIHEVHVTMNSRLDQLLKVVAEKARMEGHVEGMKEERANPQVRAATGDKGETQ